MRPQGWQFGQVIDQVIGSSVHEVGGVVW